MTEQKEFGLVRQLLHGGVGSFLSKVAEVGLGLIVSVLLARLLGASGYGTYAFVFSLVSLVTVFVRMGLPLLVVRETARAQAESNWRVLCGVWRWANAVAFGLSLLVLALGMAALWLGWVHDPSLQQTLFWGLWLLPLFALAGVRAAALRGLRHVLAGVLPEQVMQPGIFALLLLSALLWLAGGLQPSGAMQMMVVAALVSFASGVWLLRRYRPEELRSVKPIYFPGFWFAAAWPMALTQGVDQLNRNIDVLFLGLLTIKSDVGVYRVAAQGGLIVSMGLVALGMVAAPFVARLHASGEHQKLQKLARRSAQFALAFAGMAAMGFAIVGKWLLVNLFGAEFEAAYWPLLILACGQLFNAGFGMNGMLLNMTGYERDVARVLMATVVLNGILNFALIPIWGVIGASVATSASMIVWNLWLAREVRLKLGLRSTAF